MTSTLRLTRVRVRVRVRVVALVGGKVDEHVAPNQACTETEAPVR